MRERERESESERVPGDSHGSGGLYPSLPAADRLGPFSVGTRDAYVIPWKNNLSGIVPVHFWVMTLTVV